LDLVAPATSGSTATTASFTGNFIRVVQSDPESQIIPQFNVQFDYLEALNNSSGQFLFKIESSTDGTTWSSYYETESIISSPSSANITVTPNFTSTAVANTYYRAVLYFDTPDPFEFPQIELYTGSLFLTQTPPFNALVTSSFWLTGSTSPNVLTGSQFNSDIYGISYQNEVSGSGYDYPYQLFDVQRGDQIRFAASENQAYMITNVDPPSQNINNTLYLTLDRPVVSGTLLNSFLIKKYVPNPNIVLIDAEKTGNVGSGAGFLIPEYASQTLLDKFDSIVQDLTTKGII
jgi:hypothetical protein